MVRRSLSLHLSSNRVEMMQKNSVLFSPSSYVFPLSPQCVPFHHRYPPSFRNRLLVPPSALQLQVVRFQSRQLSVAPLRCTATLETVESSTAELDFVEIGYISKVHGLQGEICVKPTTGFPELRFSQPGRRWLKQQVSGREIVHEVELVEGRGHPAHKSWILKFEGIDSVEEATQLIGSTMLVTDEDRPELEEGEFYTRDLVGMRVIHKETGETVGTVVSVYNSGANDLLHVQLESSGHNGNRKSKEAEAEAEAGASGQLVWVPFVEAIVPDVDLNKREMLITPPEGLLELNLRSDNKSKKERRQLEWKERKKFQKRLIAAKKKLSELEQQHVFHGFRYGEKTQGRLLADQIVNVNSKLLQQALQNIQITSERVDGLHLLDVTRSGVQGGLEISKDCFASFPNMEKLGASLTFHESGCRLISDGKVAIVLVVNESENMDLSDPACWSETISHVLSHDDQKLVQVEDRTSVPLVLISKSHGKTSLESVFMDNDYFGFDSTKVWFLEEEVLPVVSCLLTGEETRHKILMKSPWEILQSPVGSGGIITVLSSNKMLENLSQVGVDYIQVLSCNNDGRFFNGQALLLGYMHSKEANVGIQILEAGASGTSEESLNIVLSTNYLKKLGGTSSNKVQFFGVPKLNSHVELVEKEWVDVVPSLPNSYEIHSSIYGLIHSSCPSDKLCLLHITTG